MDTFRVLIVDDEPEFRNLLVEALEGIGYSVEGAENGESALEKINQRHFAIVFTDLNMPGGISGLDLMREIQTLDPKTFCILMTGYATTESAIQALKRGAYDFIQKPFKLAELEASLIRALGHYRSLRENERYQSRLEEMVQERTQEILGLKEDIEQLFDGFVKASVMAIEARDPSTSGHSARVADLTVGLAEAVNRTPNGTYGHVQFSERQIKEIRYASLLHDFGKVGVREQVLVKARKLQPERLERILQRLYQRDMERAVAMLDQARQEGRDSGGLSLQSILAERRHETQRLVDLILRCNEPQVLPREIAEAMDDLENLQFLHWEGGSKAILEPEDIAALRIPKGSLSGAERDEINSHVTHTFRFLSQIPWTDSFASLPEIAYAHHERLNGQGYPRGLKSDQIPVQSKLMAVADVYDALVAADRPYKVAVTVPRSLEILDNEVKSGLLDAEAFRIFVDARIYELAIPNIKN
ncbi:MAG TPA: response regulator [Holophaga sp.]|jgi:response regulator RpfG family c-di-GMP phosphodiesterase|nr:response regulator [Holophaga sp.]